eukprot:10356858-Lingulodinium_polyedra.AAC.1
MRRRALAVRRLRKAASASLTGASQRPIGRTFRSTVPSLAVRVPWSAGASMPANQSAAAAS